MKRSVAVILSRFPYPLEKGDKLRAYHQIVYLSRFCDITLHVLETKPVPQYALDHLRPFCSSLFIYTLNKTEIAKGIWQALRKGDPVQVGYFYSERINHKMQQDLDSYKPDVIYAQLSRTARYVKDRKEYKVCDFQDAFSLNYARHAQNSMLLKKWFYQREARCMAHFEQKMLSWFDAHTIISEMDRLAISPRIQIVSNGVDSEKFKPIAKAKKYDVLFTGNLSYEPNQLAVQYLVKEIIPLVLQKNPSLRFAIAGANMPYWMKKLQSAHLDCLGWVDDIAILYNEARLFVAPLFSGAGLQNKVLEAMSCGIPVLCTTVVNASLQATSEQIILANDAASFAEHIVHLANNEAEQQEYANQARAFILQHYQWPTENEKLRKLLRVNDGH